MKACGRDDADQEDAASIRMWVPHTRLAPRKPRWLAPTGKPPPGRYQPFPPKAPGAEPRNAIVSKDKRDERKKKKKKVLNYKILVLKIIKNIIAAPCRERVELLYRAEPEQRFHGLALLRVRGASECREIQAAARLRAASHAGVVRDGPQARPGSIYTRREVVAINRRVGVGRSPQRRGPHSRPVLVVGDVLGIVVHGHVVVGRLGTRCRRRPVIHRHLVGLVVEHRHVAVVVREGRRIARARPR